MKTHSISTLEELSGFARAILDMVEPHFDQAFIITLSGDLGTGKTTLTQALGNLLKIEVPISSPTYVIEQRYAVRNHKNWNELVHMDAYRLDDPEDPQKIGLDQTLLDTNRLVVIEWPEKIADFLGKYKTLDISLEFEDENRVANLA